MCGNTAKNQRTTDDTPLSLNAVRKMNKMCEKKLSFFSEASCV